MSHNPYAANGYGGSANGTNPYAPTNASNSIPSGRYADPYLNQQNNASSASVNSFGSQERRRRSNPYEQRGRDSPGPTTPGRIGPGIANAGGAYAPGGGGAGGGGYGGLARPRYAEEAPAPRNDNSYSREREPQGNEQRQQRPPTRERDRANNDPRFRENRDIRNPMPPPPTMPSKSSLPSLNQQSRTNGYSEPSYPLPENANRQYSPRRPQKSMDEILRHIQSNWKDMEGDECIPVRTALKLMDPSSLGLKDKEEDFSNTHVDLQKCLKSVVNEHYADFNSAVGTYHKIQNAIRESQSRVRLLKGGLMNVKGGMLSTRPELRGLAEQSGDLDHMLVMLSNIESLKDVPSKLEEKISEKKFLGAVDLLMDSLKAITKSELDGIGAVSDLRSYFITQESTLLDILVEELHDHLYLRSPYCKDRWKGKKANGEERDSKDNLTGSVAVWDRPFNHYLNSADFSIPMVEDASKNPEADTFYYTHMILEALHKIGQLGEAISRIEQRMPTELYKVVEKTNQDIDAKYPSHLRGQVNKDSRKVMSLQIHDGRAQVLSDFLWTLYSKFEAIAESHRVLHEVITGIATREKLSKPDRYTTGFKELWKLYQMEMRSLLHDYLATDGSMTLRSGLTRTTSTDIFARPIRDKNKKMFKLSGMEQKSEAMKAEEDELEDILKSSVPGLVSKSRARNGLDLISERSGQDSSAAGHKLLIEPSVFNMTVLLPPSLTFLQRLKDVVPSTAHIPMSTLTSFLDDFLINVFHPQLEEAVTELCIQCMIDLEAFSEDTHWSKHSPHPIFKGAVSFMGLIRAFSGMLSSIPQDQMFTQLIINQLITYYDKCYGYYKALVSRVAPSTTNQNVNNLALKAAAAFAESGEVRDAAVDLLKYDHSSASGGNPSRSDLIMKEVQALLSATKQHPLSSYDIISDPKSVHQLSLLHNSMQWLSTALTQIRHVETSSHTGHARNSMQPKNAKRWTLITGLRSLGGGKSPSHPGATVPVFLPLTSETAIPFDNIVTSFRMLAQTSLLTLHIDIRCGILHQLARTLRGPGATEVDAAGNGSTISPSEKNLNSNRDSSGLPPLDSGLYPYVLPSPPASASPLILELNTDLIAFDANIATYLGTRERNFILHGLARLVDRYLVVAADVIGVMNTNGAERVRIDAMVMQQNLRAILASTTSSSPAKDSSSTSITTGQSTNPTTDAATGLGISTVSSAPQRPEDDDDDSGLLTSSSRYFNLFLQGPDSILQHVRDRKAQKKDVGYSYDELRTLVELCYSADLRGEDREKSIKARKAQQEVLLALGEVMWDS
ncbi:exocyst subunit [Exophiala xenobiotica]|uniref:Exocyst complex component Sec8 n=1 Tax=Vermiconidia calcicola TaxID=1690605 RepID=A0AAV9QQ54_9PEZI|nr:exocyst subunit [Exophiala xenobiotica]KAK5545565.1 exocyst subunit [Vermiconidia calcicola]